jgi:hypothetical protein
MGYFIKNGDFIRRITIFTHFICYFFVDFGRNLINNKNEIQVGDYQLEIFINGHPIEQSPLLVTAFNPRKVNVKVVSPGEELVPKNPVQLLGG